MKNLYRSAMMAMATALLMANTAVAQTSAPDQKIRVLVVKMKMAM